MTHPTPQKIQAIAFNQDQSPVATSAADIAIAAMSAPHGPIEPFWYTLDLLDTNSVVKVGEREEEPDGRRMFGPALGG